jgi:CheY-like chemotaxis protein
MRIEQLDYIDIGAQNAGIDPHGTTILVADDSELVLNETCRILSKMGFNVLKAADGEEAIEICKERAVDLALIDMVMPRKDGVEVFQFLYKNKPHIKLILMSVVDLPPKFISRHPECHFLAKSHLFSKLGEHILEVLK